jgi:hypothetical protein
MYVIKHKDRIISGPKEWDPNFFSFALQKEKIDYRLPRKAPTQLPFVIDENTTVYKAKYVYPEYNSKIEYLHGPFWSYEGSEAIGTFEVKRTDIQLVKNTLKNRVSDLRYKEEIAGIKVTINDVEVSIDTSREGRTVYYQKLVTMSETETVNWKFKEQWVNLTKTNLQTIVNAIELHVQECFNRELTKITTIESLSSYEELDSFKIGDEPKTLEELVEEYKNK